MAIWESTKFGQEQIWKKRNTCMQSQKLVMIDYQIANYK
jgi:hypothetical protein